MLVLHRQQVLVQVRVPVVVYGVCSDKYLRGREHNPHTHTFSIHVRHHENRTARYYSSTRPTPPRLALDVIVVHRHIWRVTNASSRPGAWREKRRSWRCRRFAVRGQFQAVLGLRRRGSCVGACFPSWHSSGHN